MSCDATRVRNTPGMPEDGLRNLLFRSAIGSISVKIGNAAAVFSISVILARVLGPEAFCFYAYVFALISLLTVLAKAGLPELLVREIARYKVDEDWSTMRTVLSLGNRAAILTTTAVVIISVIVLGANAADLDTVAVLTYGWAILLIPVFVFSELRGGAIRGWGHVVAGQLPSILLRPTGLVMLLLLAMTFDYSLSPSVAMALHLVAALLAFSFGIVWSRKIFSPLSTSVLTKGNASEWIKKALPFTMLAGVMVIDSNLDVLMLGWLASDADVGIYRVASQTVVVVAFAISSLNMVVAPHVTRLFRTGNMAGLQQMVTLSSRVIAVTGIPVAVVLIVWGEVFLATVFGKEYLAATIPLSILCVGQIVNLLMGINGTILSMTQYASVSAWIIAAGASLNVVLNIWLIPIYGTSGAAMATASSLAVWNILLSIAVYRRLKIRTTAFGL